MKKYSILFILFILPIVAYLFFASGVNSFAKLPTITSKIPEISQWASLDGKPVSLKNKITILGFTGTEIIHNEGNFFNLNQKIYNHYKDFKDFQFVMVAPKGTEAQVKELLEKLKPLANQDISKWVFVFASPGEIAAYYSKLNLVGQLDKNSGTSNVYIVDKERNLRGRKGENPEGKNEYKEGYNTISAAELHNEMGDDVKIILYEYRAALKKNNKYKRQI